MSKFITSFSLLILLAGTAFAWLSYSKAAKKLIVYKKAHVTPKHIIDSKELLKLQSKALTAKAFAKENNFDSSLCFLIDMSLPANHKRFFVYDFKEDKVQRSGLVTHGNCNQYWLEGRKYEMALAVDVLR